MRIVQIAFLTAAASAAPSRLLSQAPVRAPDFVVGGISSTVDSAQVRRLLGAPDSVTAGDHPYDATGKLIDWWYPEFRILYNGGERVGAVWILGSRAATHRGLRVGDSRSRVRALYGAPTSVDSASNAWVYRDTERDSETHLIKVFFGADRVRSIFIGWVLD